MSAPSDGRKLERIASANMSHEDKHKNIFKTYADGLITIDECLEEMRLASMEFVKRVKEILGS